ncbi:MAG: RNA polymerase sigma-70 factor [Prolixibacteraceae bacterium]
MLPYDKQLFNILMNGDETSFKAVYDHFYPRLYYFVFEYIQHKDLAEDIVHDTFLTLWKKRTGLQADTNLNAYLYTLAKNNSLKKLRDEKYRKTVFSSTRLTADEIEFNTGALSSLWTTDLTFPEVERIIQSTLSQLPPQCKLVFELSRFANRKNKEIADELGISVKTVEGHITKAIKSLKVNLKDYLPLAGFLFLP